MKSPSIATLSHRSALASAIRSSPIWRAREAAGRRALAARASLSASSREIGGAPSAPASRIVTESAARRGRKTFDFIAVHTLSQRGEVPLQGENQNFHGTPHDSLV